MRKRVVEFDDVINRQRETIYAERDKVLRNEDLTETVRTFLDDEIDAIVDQHLSADVARRWGMEALVAALQAMGLDGPGTTEDELWDVGSKDQILEHLLAIAEEQLEHREDELASSRSPTPAGPRSGEADWAMVERIVLLRTIDSLWVEHLTELDDMRRGIGLRGYAQQDPLNEFRREAFELYGELRELHPPPGRDDDLPGHRDPPAAARARSPCSAASPRVPRGLPRPRPRPVSRRVAGATGGGAGTATAPPAARAARVHRVPSCKGVAADPMASRPARWRQRRRRRTARRSRGSRRPAPGSDATIRAGAGPARSTRSATAADRRLSPAP